MLVGLRVNLALNETVTNVVLVLGALTVIANAWDSFYDHRGLWVTRTAKATPKARRPTRHRDCPTPPLRA